jgi:hypothetical protein
LKREKEEKKNAKPTSPNESGGAKYKNGDNRERERDKNNDRLRISGLFEWFVLPSCRDSEVVSFSWLLILFFMSSSFGPFFFFVFVLGSPKVCVWGKKRVGPQTNKQKREGRRESCNGCELVTRERIYGV